MQKIYVIYYPIIVLTMLSASLSGMQLSSLPMTQKFLTKIHYSEYLKKQTITINSKDADLLTPERDESIIKPNPNGNQESIRLLIPSFIKKDFVEILIEDLDAAINNNNKSVIRYQYSGPEFLTQYLNTTEYFNIEKKYNNQIKLIPSLQTYFLNALIKTPDNQRNDIIKQLINDQPKELLPIFVKHKELNKTFLSIYNRLQKNYPSNKYISNQLPTAINDAFSEEKNRDLTLEKALLINDILQKTICFRKNEEIINFTITDDTVTKPIKDLIDIGIQSKESIDAYNNNKQIYNLYMHKKYTKYFSSLNNMINDCPDNQSLDEADEIFDFPIKNNITQATINTLAALLDRCGDGKKTAEKHLKEDLSKFPFTTICKLMTAIYHLPLEEIKYENNETINLLSLMYDVYIDKLPYKHPKYTNDFNQDFIKELEKLLMNRPKLTQQEEQEITRKKSEEKRLEYNRTIIAKEEADRYDRARNSTDYNTRLFGQPGPFQR